MTKWEQLFDNYCSKFNKKIKLQNVCMDEYFNFFVSYLHVFANENKIAYSY